MQKSQGVASFLVPTDPHTPAAMHPTLRAVHHPPPGFATRLLPQPLGFFPPRTARGGEAKLLQEVPDRVIVLACLQAQPLRRVGGRGWPLCSAPLEGCARHRAIMAVRAVHGESARAPAAVGAHAAVGAARATIRGVLAPLFPPQGGLWSSRRPAPATPTQGPARRHMPPGPVPTRPQRRPRPSMLGHGAGRRDGNSGPSRAGHATDTLCGARTRGHPSPGAHRRGADGTPREVVCAVGGVARCAPTTRQGGARHGELARGRQASGWLREENSVSHRIP